MEDALIVDLYWARDEQALAETAAKFGTYCRKIADNILHSAHDAEECENDTWLAAWNSMPTNRPARLAPYLGRITRNLAFHLNGMYKTGDRNEFLFGGHGVVFSLWYIPFGSQVIALGQKNVKVVVTVGRSA